MKGTWLCVILAANNKEKRVKEQTPFLKKGEMSSKRPHTTTRSKTRGWNLYVCYNLKRKNKNKKITEQCKPKSNRPLAGESDYRH